MLTSVNGSTICRAPSWRFSRATRPLLSGTQTTLPCTAGWKTGSQPSTTVNNGGFHALVYVCCLDSVFPLQAWCSTVQSTVGQLSKPQPGGEPSVPGGVHDVYVPA